MVTADALLRDASALTDTTARVPGGPADLVDGVPPSVVVEPASIEGVAAVLAWASSTGLSVVLRGAGTRDAWGRVPRPVDVLLGFRNLNRVVEHEAGDLTATVEAGALLGDVNAVCARHRQWLPLDPPSGRGRTIGGILATNDTGPLRHRFGTPRDLLIGMTIVTADGSMSSSGGRVVKNVAGYDVGRLMTGSHGSLAAIVRASFKLSPCPPVARTLRVRLARASDVGALVDLLRQSQLEPEVLDFHMANASRTARISVLVRHATIGEAVDAACRQTVALAGQIGAATDSAEGAEADRWWAAHEAAPDGPGRMRVRLGWKPADFEHAATALLAAVDGASFDWIGRAAVGSGEVGIGGDATRHAAIVDALRSGPRFSHVVVVDAPTAFRRQVDVWAPSSSQQILWRALKTACDPKDTLGAGRGPL